MNVCTQDNLCRIIARSFYVYFMLCRISRGNTVRPWFSFISQTMRSFTDLRSIAQVFSAWFNLQANGIVEALNGSLKEMLAKVATNFLEDWDLHLPAVLFAYREVPQRSAGVFTIWISIRNPNAQGVVFVWRDVGEIATWGEYHLKYVLDWHKTENHYWVQVRQGKSWKRWGITTHIC